MNPLALRAIDSKTRPWPGFLLDYDASMDSTALEIAPGLTLPRDWLEVSFTRASGPGGQNVNKRSTAVLLRVCAAHLAQLLPPEAYERLRLLAGPAWVGEGEEQSLLLRADAERSQAANREACEARLVTLLKMALVKPKTRKKTKVSRGAKKRRLADKKKLSEKKGARRGG